MSTAESVILKVAGKDRYKGLGYFYASRSSRAANSVICAWLNKVLSVPETPPCTGAARVRAGTHM